jgi:DNA-binding CsgD family transcriptional regulator
MQHDGVAMVQMHRRKGRRLGDLGALRNPAFPDLGDALSRKRRLIAAFCRMLGEQLMDGKPVPLTGQRLSHRQRQTLELLLSGNAEKQIAAHLSISRHTVHVYVKSLYKRFGVCSRGELLARWVHK